MKQHQIPVIAILNSRVDFSTTFLTYHLAWAFADLGRYILCADANPQAHLSMRFLETDLVAQRMERNETIYSRVKPYLQSRQKAKSSSIVLEPIADEYLRERIALVCGDFALATLEEPLTIVWRKFMQGGQRAIHTVTAFGKELQVAGNQHGADLILVECDSHLSAVTRSVLANADYIITPIVPDRLTAYALTVTGKTVTAWREAWQQRLQQRRLQTAKVSHPAGQFQPLGYVVLQPVESMMTQSQPLYGWLSETSKHFHNTFLENSPTTISVEKDPYCLAQIRNYHTLISVAEDVVKPIFHLKSGDGALGAYTSLAFEIGGMFRSLATKIAEKIELPLGERVASTTPAKNGRLVMNKPRS